MAETVQTNWEDYALLAKQQVEENQLEAAIANYEKAIELGCDKPWVYIKLGDVYSNIGKFELALERIETAIALDEKNVWGYVAVAQVLRKEGKIEEALEKCEAGLEVSPGQEDLELLKRSLQQEPEGNWLDFAIQAQEKAEAGKIEEAIRFYEQAISLNPDEAWPYLKLAQLVSREKKLKLYKKAIEVEDKNPWGYIESIQLLKTENRLEEALDIYEEALVVHPDNEKIKNLKQGIEDWLGYATLANKKSEEGDKKEAIQLYEKAISLKPSEAWPYLKLGSLYSQSNKGDEALALFDQVRIKESDNALSYILSIEILIRQKKLQDSAILCYEALKIHSDNVKLQSLCKKIQEEREKSKLPLQQIQLKEEDNYHNSPFYDGLVERADSDFIVGWARDRNNPERNLILDVYIDTVWVASYRANKYRADLAKAFENHGCYGFVIEVPKTSIFQNKISVSVKLRYTNKDIRNSPITVLTGSPGQKHTNYHQDQHFYLVRNNLYRAQHSDLSVTTLPKVALIILNLNGASVLDKLFASFQAYNSYKNSEIIVVDHNSEDQSVIICKSWSEYLPIKVIERNGNYSFSESNNLAAHSTDAPLLFFVNNDMMFCQDIIPELVKTIQDKNIGIVGIKLLDIIDNEQHGLPPTQHLGVQFDFYSQHRIFRPFDIRYSSHWLGVNSSAWLVPATTGAAMICRRDDFIAIGGFDENYFYGYEDVDLCLSFQRELNKSVVCVNNLTMFHHRGLTRFNNPSPTFALRQSDNSHHIEKRFGYYARRQHLSDFFDRGLFWTSSPLRIGFAVTEASLDASAGDYFTALELGENLVEEFGWEVFYISQKEKNWYDMSSLDVLVVMRDDYNLTELRNCKPSLVKVMWIRNWFERLTEREWVGDYDLIWASSPKAVQYLEDKLSKPVCLMQIATQSKRFQEAEFEPEFASDYCFTGSYWKSPREIIDFLEPNNLPFDFALYGYNWEAFDKIKPYYRGSLAYTEMSKVYASTKIVVDDANIVTKEWGSVNSRVFDALSAGALVITNGKSGSKDVFDGLLPTYDSQESLEKLLNDFLTNESKRVELVNQLQTVVSEKHTYKNRAYTAFQSLRDKMSSTFRVSIKIGAPRWEGVNEWGDYHFALAMKRAFERKGHSVRIDILPEWDTYKNYGDDVVIVLRGLSEYKPKSYNINLMWNISHPDKVSIHEYEQYDHIFIASTSYVEELSQKLKVPVDSLLQCTDPDVFYPDREGEEEVGQVLFVGNSRKVYRKIVKDAVSSGVQVDVYGTNWEYFIPPDYIKGEHIPNNILRRYYTQANVILNDHWETMSRYGFLSNRLFDAAACGASIISDQVPSLEEVFGDHVVTYSSPQELPKLIQEILELKESHQEKKEKLSQYIRENHSFEKRVETMLQVIEKLHQEKMKF